MTNEQESKIKKLYEEYCYAERVKPYDEYDPSSIQAIQQVLKILGLKIEGINC